MCACMCNAIVYSDEAEFKKCFQSGDADGLTSCSMKTSTESLSSTPICRAFTIVILVI